MKRKLAFWFAVGGVSLVASASLQAVANQWPTSAFAKLNALVKKG